MVRSTWPVIGKSELWRSAASPLPAFGRRGTSARCYRVEYEPHDLSGPCREIEVGEDECHQLPRDALSGSGRRVDHDGIAGHQRLASICRSADLRFRSKPILRCRCLMGDLGRSREGEERCMDGLSSGGIGRLRVVVVRPSECMVPLRH